MVTLERIKRITSHVGKARFLAECAETPLGVIARRPDIPSPYAYSPTWTVEAWHRTPTTIIPVVIIETAHKQYDVFRVTGPVDPRESAS